MQNISVDKQRSIMLKVNDTSPTQAFTTHEEFEDYLDQIINC